MAEFIRTEEKVVNVGEPVIFENNTDSDFSVNAAIVFRKSGLYDVSIVGRRTIISKVAERKKGEWKVQTDEDRPFIWWKCSECGHIIFSESERDRRTFHAFCGRCGADMRGDSDD